MTKDGKTTVRRKATWKYRRNMLLSGYNEPKKVTVEGKREFVSDVKATLRLITKYAKQHDTTMVRALFVDLGNTLQREY